MRPSWKKRQYLVQTLLLAPGSVLPQSLQLPPVTSMASSVTGNLSIAKQIPFTWMSVCLLATHCGEYDTHTTTQLVVIGASSTCTP